MGVSIFTPIAYNIIIYPVLVLFGQSHCIDWIMCLLYTVTDQDIAILVPDSCLSTVRNGNSISADFTENTIRRSF